MQSHSIIHYGHVCYHIPAMFSGNASGQNTAYFSFIGLFFFTWTVHAIDWQHKSTTSSQLWPPFAIVLH